MVGCGFCTVQLPMQEQERVTDALLRRFGLLGYRLEWESEFPLSLYLKIRDIASGQCKLSVSALPEEENCGMVAQCSDFAAECSNLNEINR